MKHDVPDILIAENASAAFAWGFGILVLMLLIGFICVKIWQRRAEMDGIYAKYQLPQDATMRRSRH